MPELDPKEMVTIAHPGVLRRARVKRSAVPTHARSGWYVVGPDAPVTGKQARRARKRTSAGQAGTEQVSDTTSSPAAGDNTEEE